MSKKSKMKLVPAPVGTPNVATMEPPTVSNVVAMPENVPTPTPVATVTVHDGRGFDLPEALKSRRAADSEGKGFGPILPPSDPLYSSEKLGLADVEPLGNLNPRIDFDRERIGTMNSLVVEGQKEPCLVGTLTGEALKYASRINGKDYSEKTVFVLRGNRRHSFIGGIHAAALALGNVEETARWSGIYVVRHPRIIGSIRELCDTIQDQLSRVGLTHRFELARSMKLLSDAGYTLSAIADHYPSSKGTNRVPFVQTHLNIFKCPDTREFPVQTMIQRGDVEAARIARGEIEELPAGVHVWTSEDVTEAMNAWNVETGSKKPTDYKSPPRPIRELIPAIIAREKTVKPREDRDVKATRIKAFVTEVRTMVSGESLAIILATIEALRDDTGIGSLAKYRDVTTSPPSVNGT